MDEKPKKKRRSLKRDIREFMARVIEDASNSDGFLDAMQELGWGDHIRSQDEACKLADSIKNTRADIVVVHLSKSEKTWTDYTCHQCGCAVDEDMFVTLGTKDFYMCEDCRRHFNPYEPAVD